MAYEIWHNPRCSKSRATLALLQDASVPVRVRRYQDDPPTVADLEEVLKRLEVGPEAITRMREAARSGIELSASTGRGPWLEILAQNPALIERPIVVTDDGRAAIGRPPENVRDILP